nr:MAG TPA: hypothetical protein [Crassvirales sp.]
MTKFRLCYSYNFSYFKFRFISFVKNINKTTLIKTRKYN